MCGINGFTFRDEGAIQEMNRLTSHRGPDATDFYIGEGISLGHNRLAIIDLSPEAGQPMRSAEGRHIIVFNGEIYNFEELKNELSGGYQFKTKSDTEVILAAYQAYGPACVRRFNGIFALAIWDTAKRELFIARDHSGIKPLYYWQAGDRFIFSSEIKAIVAHQEVPRRVSHEAASFYFQLLYVPEPFTMFEGVYKLPAATYGIFKNGELTLTRYWQVADFSNFPTKTTAIEQVRQVFKDSVKRQLISDRPVGVFLSGGLDSTAVLGAVREYKGHGVKTFSVGFGDHREPEKFNADFDLARTTARLYETDHHELIITAKDIADAITQIAWHLDEPNSNPTAGAIFLLSRLAKKEVAVVLGGDGGDELFGGYPRYYYSRIISAAQLIPGFSLMARLGSGRLSGRFHKFSLLPNEERIAAFLAQKESEVARILQPALADRRLVFRHFQEKFTGIPKVAFRGDFEKYFFTVDRQSWLVDESLIRTDKMSMAFGLEARVPILDYRLIETAARIPSAWQIPLFQRPRAFQGKRLWRQAVRQYVPDHVFYETKRGWFTPMAKWLRNELKPLAEEILLGGYLPEEYFNRAGVERMWQDHLDLKRYNLSLIWAVMMWQLWYERFIQKRAV